MPGGPRSPWSPLGPAVPLQREQKQKNGIWSIGGGTGWFSSMSQIAVSVTGGIVIAGPPVGGNSRPPEREEPGHTVNSSDELSGTPGFQFSSVPSGSSMAEQKQHRGRSPSSLSSICSFLHKKSVSNYLQESLIHFIFLPYQSKPFFSPKQSMSLSFPFWHNPPWCFPGFGNSTHRTVAHGFVDILGDK